MKQFFFFFFSLLFPFCACGNDIVLRNPQTVVRVIASDSGYYTGSRFETAGFIREFRFGNYNFFGKNYGSHRDPAAADHVCGQAEDFESPLYLSDDHSVFMKIGNGVFRKKEQEPYEINGTYECLKRFPWEMKRSGRKIIFFQQGEWEDFSYEYWKTIELSPDLPELTVRYLFVNTGKKEISGTQYAHNFIALNDEVPAGTYMTMPLPFMITPKRANPPWRCSRGKILFQELKPSFSYVRYSGRMSAEICFPGGMGIRLMDDSAEKCALHTGMNYICPEFFTTFRLRPGEKVRFARKYEIKVKEI